MTDEFKEKHTQDFPTKDGSEEILSEKAELENTVERNLASLREMVAAQSAAMEQTPEAKPTSEEELVDAFPALEVEEEEVHISSPEAIDALSEKIEHIAEEKAPEELADLEATQVFSEAVATQALTSDEVPSLENTVISNKQPVARKTTLSRRNAEQHKKKQEKVANRIVTGVVILVLIVLGITAFSGYSYIKSSLEPIDASATEYVQVEIPEGSSTSDIGRILQDNGLIKNATIFSYYARLKSYNDFQSGYYNLSQNMSLDDLAKALQEAGAEAPQEPIAGKVLVIEGYTIDQIAQAVTDNVYTEDEDDTTPFTAEDFLSTVQNEEFINRMVATYPTLFASLPSADSGVRYRLEGYLFPATYEYTDDTTIEELVEQMIAAMDSNLQAYYDQLAGKGLDVNSLLTLASLVEKEGSTDEDRRNIASVFYNRLNSGMALQSNIAILYAMGVLGDETTLEEDVSVDTSIDSPFNIYTNTGLMPGPVASPSLAAIEATVNPNETGYYYFVADVTTGTVYFATTYEEHAANVEQYVNSHLTE